MKILAVLASGALCAVMGLLLAGLIASLCVEWYHISSFEGGSGYYVVFIALGGFVAGLVAGLAISGILISNDSSLGRAVGISAGAVTGVAIVALGLSWFFGDIPPKLRGDTLMVLLEFRAPEGWQPPVAAARTYNSVTLDPVNSTSATGHRSYSTVEWGSIPKNQGRIVIPVALDLFRTNSQWRAELSLEGRVWARALMQLPRDLATAENQWTEWLPTEEGPDLERGFEYRYQLQRRQEWRAQEDAIKEEKLAARQKRFEALNESSPVRDWLEFRQPWEWDNLGVHYPDDRKGIPRLGRPHGRSGGSVERQRPHSGKSRPGILCAHRYGNPSCR
jgi:hypothetical protein